MLTYHFPVYVLYIFSLTYDIVNIEVGWQGYGGKFKFLTFWNLVSGISSAYYDTEQGKKPRSRALQLQPCFVLAKLTVIN